MYAFVDQSVSCLEGGSLMVLRGMRVWVLAANQRTCPLRSIIPEMGRVLSNPDDLRDFHRLMLLLHKNGLRPMQFAVPDSRRITESEALMLGLWADCCAARSTAMRCTLGLLVADAAVQPMQALFDRLAACLSVVGLAPSGVRRDPASQPGSDARA